MEKYESLSLLGEGSCGAVMKCRNKDNGRIVAIKKFLESEGDKIVKKIVTREIKLLKIIHRDIKPENILISESGVVKLCDFGFARMLGAPGEVYTDYVATCWYRAPELLVGDIKYGNLIPRHQELFYENPVFASMNLPEVEEGSSLESRCPKLPPIVIDMAKKCLQIDPDQRPFCDELLHHDFFNQDEFAERFSQELKLKIQKDAKELSSIKISEVSKKENDDSSGEERKTLVVQVPGSSPPAPPEAGFPCVEHPN